MESSKHLDEDSVEYWKEQAKHYEQKAREIQQELDEYTENSAQLERELETSLEQVEKQNRDLEQKNERLLNKIDDLKTKLDRSQHETSALENELKALNIEKEKQAIYIRELEQKNDDLERGQRIISESVSCIETLLNQAYERNAVLESEVDEMETLRVKLQRATDEARDLKQELKVIEKIPILKKEDSSTNENICNGHSTRTQVEIETQTSITSPRREVNGNAMTPSSRVSAINIVGDLLRKVGALESKLASCRGTVRPKEHSPNPTSDVNKDYRCVLKN